MAKAEQVRQAIGAFLGDMLEKKTIERQKEIDGLIANGVADDDPKMVSAIQKLEAAELNYEYDNWLKTAANKMVHHVTLATHISKGVHSMSRGDSVLFKNTDNLPAHLAGSHSTPTRILDISGSASALPLYNFINTPVGNDKIIRDLIETRDNGLIQALSTDKAIALSYLKSFKSFLNQVISEPATSNLNKQLLFPINGDELTVENPDDPKAKAVFDNIDAYEYLNIVPLYASVFCHEVKQKVNAIRFSEDNKAAVSQRFSADANDIDQVPYQTIRDLGVLKLGGSKPANISKVVVMSGGETLLLPSLPPTIVRPKDFELSTLTNSLFKSVAFNRLIRHALNALASAYIHYGYQPNYENKRQKRNALYFLLITIFDLSVGLRTREAGWLENHNLSTSQKYWLDPNRGNLTGQEAYKAARAAANWQDDILDDIARYINSELHSMLIRNANEFNEDTFDEWRKEAAVIANKYKLNGSEVLA